MSAVWKEHFDAQGELLLETLVQNSYRDDLVRASAVYYRVQIETADHMTMF